MLNLEAFFYGNPTNEDNQYQFVLPNPVLCDQIKIEFIEVTENAFFSKSYHIPIASSIIFLQSISTNTAIELAKRKKY